MAKSKWDYSFVWDADNGLGHLILETKEGKLKCSGWCAPDEYWCSHIADAVRAHADAESLWKIPDDRFPHIIQVPLYPTGRLWVAVELRKSNLVPTALRIVLHTPQEAVDLGFINPGDARMVIRSLVLDYFQTMILPALPDLACKSSSHGFKNEMIWQENLKGELRTFELWSVYWHDLCITCYAAASTWTDPDLVPPSQIPKFTFNDILRNQLHD